LPGEGPQDGDQKQAQKFSQPCEDEAEVVSDGGEDGELRHRHRGP
jgi:hypothetical protein